MSNHHEQSETLINSNKQAVNRRISNLIRELHSQNTLVAETPLARFQKVLKIYRSLKPLFAVLENLPLIPLTWRTALVMLDQALEALSGIGGEITAQFKAGKDI